MSHYSLAHTPLKMIPWAKRIAVDIADEWKDSENIPVLIYQGMSGIAHATAISLMYALETGKTIGMVYVRKEDEVSHGSRIEFEYEILHPHDPVIGYKKNIHLDLIFVDDFWETGETFARCLEQFDQYHLCTETNISKLRVFYAVKKFQSIRPIGELSNFYKDQRNRISRFLEKYCKDSLTEQETPAIISAHEPL